MLDYNEDEDYRYSYTKYECHAIVDKYSEKEERIVENKNKVELAPYTEYEEKDVSKSEETNIVNLLKREVKSKRTTGTLRASCYFSLSDKNNKREKYLGLLDTGSTRSLMDKGLVEKYKMKLLKDVGVLTTNTGTFRTT